MSIDRKAIESIIESRILPLLRVDGGDLTLVSFNEDAALVTVRFGGTYRGNPCRKVVLDFVVAPMLTQETDAALTVEMAD